MKPPATLGRMRVQFHIKVRSSPRLQDKWAEVWQTFLRQCGVAVSALFEGGEYGPEARTCR